MRRRTKWIWATALGVPLLLAVVFLMQSGLVRRSDADLETVLANDNPAPIAPSVERDWIVEAVRDATGRDLTIEGEFDAYLLPLPGLLIGRASLSNAAGFGDEPFAAIEGMELRVGSLSPFNREIRVERMALAGFRLNLARDAEGQDNWSNPAEDSRPAATPAPEADDGTWSVAIDAFEIADAEVSWQDARSGAEWQLKSIDFRASALNPGESFPLALSFAFDSAETTVAVESAMRMFANVDQSRAVFESIDISFSQFDPADLLAVLESLNATDDHELLARASSGSSLRITGDGTIDFRTRALDLRGDMLLNDGTVLPLTIGGTLDAPRYDRGAGP